MHFNSRFKYCFDKSFKKMNKNSFKMFNCSANRMSEKFVTNFLNKFHFVDRVKFISNVSNLQLSFSNLYNNPQMDSEVFNSNSLVKVSILGIGINYETINRFILSKILGENVSGNKK